MLATNKEKAKKPSRKSEMAYAVDSSLSISNADQPSISSRHASPSRQTGTLHETSSSEVPGAVGSPSHNPSNAQALDTNIAEKQIMASLRQDTASLTPENANLAETIGKILVKAVLAATDVMLKEERKKHEAEVQALKAKIQTLADQRDELENYTRRNTIVISGPALPKSATNEDCYDVVTKLVATTGEKITREDIDICHRLPSRNGEDDRNKKPIIAKFVRRETKHKILRACRIRQPKDIFFNESVSRTRSTILYILRRVKKDLPGRISSVKTEEGNVKVFTPPAQTGGAYIGTVINTRCKLDDFLMTKFNFRSTKYVSDKDWRQ